MKHYHLQPVMLTVDPTWTDIISKGTGIAPANISVVAYQKNSFVDKASTNILKQASFWIQLVLAAAILGLLIFVIIRSARPLTVEEKEPELSVEEMLASTRENQASVDYIDLQEKSETRAIISDATVITKWSCLTTPSVFLPRPTTIFLNTLSFISIQRFHTILSGSIPNIFPCCI